MYEISYDVPHFNVSYHIVDPIPNFIKYVCDRNMFLFTWL